MTSVHEFKAATADGGPVPLSDYAGKTLLIVNTASQCGLTPQYEGLERLYRSEQVRGLEILGFPCNQFHEQEPGTDDEIQEFCRTKYDVTFPIFAKVEVNGPNADPLFEYLRSALPGDFGPRYGEFYEVISKMSPEAGPSDVHWNFTKFLVDGEGRPVRRYEPTVLPEQIGVDLSSLL